MIDDGIVMYMIDDVIAYRPCKPGLPCVSAAAQGPKGVVVSAHAQGQAIFSLVGAGRRVQS